MFGLRVHKNKDEHAFTYVNDDDYFRSKGFLDLFTLTPFCEPRDLPCGHTYSLNGGILKHLTSKEQCPMKCPN